MAVQVRSTTATLPRYRHKENVGALHKVWSFDTPVEESEIEEAIARLPDGARDVLVLSGIYGYSHMETAQMLGIAEGTCKAQLHRARKLLAERLNVGLR